ncbi:MAG: glycosyltransferase family 39 protein [Thermincola sp.]|nr:glycosyltransferase family 39 protein [Thermincola sp.]MDT3703457.1 glycosyltransferase family 39 protein [Thermincola sp.]
MQKRILWLLIVIITAGAVWFTYYNSTFQHLFLNDAMDYASIGRNIAAGDGFVSSYITPLSLANYQGLPHPDLWRAPLWPLILAMFIKLFGATDQAVAIATGFFYIAGAALIFLLAAELFDTLVGLAAAVLYIFSAQNLMNSVSGMTETVSVCMMLLAVYLITVSRARTPWGEILAGAAMGLFYLTRYNALLFLPFFVIYLWYTKMKVTKYNSYVRQKSRQLGQGFWPVVRYLTAFVMVTSPWLFRNYILMGNPLFSLQQYEPVMFTSAYPGYSLYMMFEKVKAGAFVMAHPQEIWAKIVTGWAEFEATRASAGFAGVSPYLFLSFLISLVVPFTSGYASKHKGLRPLLAACFAVQLAALLMVHFIGRLFFIFMPFYIIFGIAGPVWLCNLISKRNGQQHTVFTGAVLAVLTGFFVFTNLPVWAPHKAADMPITELRGSIKEVTDLSSKKELIISNDGHLLAWYGDRYAAKLPYKVDMIPEMEKLAPIKFIYLSSRVSWNIPEADQSWNQLFWQRPQEIYGFELIRKSPDGSLIYRKKTVIR